MKKEILLIICSTFICSIFFILIYNSFEEKFDSSIIENTINTADFDDDDEYDLTGKNIIESVGQPMKMYYGNFLELSKNVDYVVRGTIKKVDYINIKGYAWTKINLIVLDTYKGDLSGRVSIDVYFKGGYISLSEHLKYVDDYDKFDNLSEEEKSNTVFKEYNSGESDFLKKGEEVILLLIPARSYTPFPSNSFERFDSYGTLVKNGNKYVQKYSDEHDFYSIDANDVSSLKSLVNE